MDTPVKSQQNPTGIGRMTCKKMKTVWVTLPPTSFGTQIHVTFDPAVGFCCFKLQSCASYQDNQKVVSTCLLKMISWRDTERRSFNGQEVKNCHLAKGHNNGLGSSDGWNLRLLICQTLQRGVDQALNEVLQSTIGLTMAGSAMGGCYQCNGKLWKEWLWCSDGGVWARARQGLPLEQQGWSWPVRNFNDLSSTSRAKVMAILPSYPPYRGN